MTQQSETLENHIEKYTENETKLTRKLEQQKQKLNRAMNTLREKTKDEPLPVPVQFAELKMKEKAMLEMLKYLDEILQSNNIHIEELGEITRSGMKKKTDSGASSFASTGNSSMASSVGSSRPSTSASVTSLAS